MLKWSEMEEKWKSLNTFQYNVSNFENENTLRFNKNLKHLSIFLQLPLVSKCCI